MNSIVRRKKIEKGRQKLPLPLRKALAFRQLELMIVI